MFSICLSSFRFSLSSRKLTRTGGLPVSAAKIMLSGQVFFRSGANFCSSSSNLQNKMSILMLRRMAFGKRTLASSTRTSMSRGARGKGDNNNMRVAYYMAAVAVMVFGVSYASVPLYKGNPWYIFFIIMSHTHYYSFLPDDWFWWHDTTHECKYCSRLETICKWKSYQGRLYIHSAQCNALDIHPDTKIGDCGPWGDCPCILHCQE